MKDGCISKLKITESGHQGTKYKQIIDTLPAYYGQIYRCIDDVLCNGTNLVKADSTPPYQDSDLWSNTYNIEITTVNKLAVPLANSKLLPIIKLEKKTHVFKANLQKQLLSDFDQKFKIKSQEYSKFVADKKALMTIIFRQCKEVTF